MTKLEQESLEFVEIWIEEQEFGERNGFTGTNYKLTILNEETGQEWADVSFSQGSAHTKPPTVEEVLYALSMDASAGEENETFESFCYELGYDEDSRKAYAMWEACVDTYDTWTTFFTNKQQDAISEATGDM